MASSLLLLLDDITSMLDDVAVLTKVAAGKTAGVMGDDLALNAEQVSGVRVERELPVVWAVAKGSFINKLILVPAALAISAWLPAAIMPLMMIGGLFLCYEGFEKVVHKLAADDESEAHQRAQRLEALANKDVDLVAMEKTKIKGAIRTDFVLSAEIIVITLGTMTTAPFGQQVFALSLVAIGSTVLVYGLVAGIVKLDDLGMALHKRESGAARSIGDGILRATPYMMRGLSIVGTAAMFTVGGSILVHGIPPVEHLIEGIVAPLAASNGLLGTLGKMVLEAIVGVAAGALTLGIVTLGKRIFAGGKKAEDTHAAA